MPATIPLKQSGWMGTSAVETTSAIVSTHFAGSTGFVDAGAATGADSVVDFCVDGASAFEAGCVGFGASAEGFAVAFGASEVAGLVGAVATAVVAGAFALVAGAEEVSVFAAEVGVDEAGAVC